MTQDALTHVKALPPPNMNNLLDAAKRSSHAELNCCQIGEIVSFDPATQSATVKLVLKKIAAINPDSTRVLRSYPLLANVPVHFNFGGGSFISMPIATGDTCIVLFSDKDFDNWFVNGGEPAPASLRMHDLSHGICIVGIKNLQNAISNYLANGIRMFFSANSNIDLKDNAINSLAQLFTHTGDMTITGDLTILGTTFGNGSSDWIIDANIRQQAGKSIHAGNGANGTFNFVTVVDGIVISGS